MHKIIIGIDPDVDRSGVARLDLTDVPVLCLSSLPFAELLALLLSMRREVSECGAPCRVVVEAGWFNKGNWHVRWHDTTGLACAKGYQVGRNHEAGRKIAELARGLGFQVDEVRPLRKLWKGRDGKITADELRYFTGYSKRSTQDARDAALLAWRQAGLPVIVAPKH